jgi:adenylate cyclase
VNLPSESVLELSDSRDPRLGMATFEPDPADSTIRSARGLYQLRNNPKSPVYNSIVYAALTQLGKESMFPDPQYPQHFRGSRLLDGRLREERGLMDNSFEALSYYTIFFPPLWEKNYQSGAFFKDKIVYVGGTSIGNFHDEALVPNGNILGVQLQMGVLAAALQGEFYHAPTRLDRLLMTFFMSLLAFMTTFIFRHPMIGLLVLVGALVLFLKVIVPQCYEQLDVLLPSFGPALAFAASGLFCFGSQYAAEILEKARLRRTLERQVSKELAEHILSQPEDYYELLPGVRKPVTILFSDIRSFTTRSERDDPVDLVSQLKEYLDAMGKVVFKHGGVVDKFIGDAVMAVWGNIRSDGPEKDSSNAVAAAVEMMRTLRELNAGWEKRGWAPFEIGIGLNHGDAIFGMMGSQQKQEMTVIGDPVNQAARLEGLTKKFGEEIVVGTKVAEFVRGQFPLRDIGKIRTKGKHEAARLFGISSTDMDAAWLAEYHEGLALFQKGSVEEAAVKFAKCLDERKGDRLCAIYMEAIKDGDGADGVLTMKDK